MIVLGGRGRSSVADNSLGPRSSDAALAFLLLAVVGQPWVSNAGWSSVDALFLLRFFNLSPVEPAECNSCFGGEIARYLTLSSSEDSPFTFRSVLDVQFFFGLLFANKPAMVPKTPCFRCPSFSPLCFVTGEPFGSASFSAICIVLTSDRRFDLVLRFFGSCEFANRSFSTTSKGP